MSAHCGPTFLQPRELEVLFWRRHGMTNKEIALAMGVNHKTIDAQITKISLKLGARGGVLDVMLIRGGEFLPNAEAMSA